MSRVEPVDPRVRLAIASHVASGETSEAAIIVVKKGIAAHGVPQRLLSDNGAALNPSRRGVLGQLVAYLRSLGVEPITGKPYKPTTQGKNEWFHQTLFRFLDKQPLAATLELLQTQVDDFDLIYNTQRPHQALPGRITPRAAWDATSRTEPPRPVAPRAPLPAPSEEIRVKLVGNTGAVVFRGIRFGIGRAFAEQRVCVMISAPRTSSMRLSNPRRSGATL